MKLNLPNIVIFKAIRDVQKVYESYQMKIISLFQATENYIDYLYDLCNNEKILKKTQGAYKNIKNTYDVMYAYLHYAIVCYCNSNNFPIANFMNNLDEWRKKQK